MRHCKAYSTKSVTRLLTGRHASRRKSTSPAKRPQISSALSASTQSIIERADKTQASRSNDNQASLARRELAGQPQWTSGWLLPAVSEAHEVLNLVEVRVAGVELGADALDVRPDIAAIAMVAAAGDEASVVNTVVDRAVGHVATGVGCQKIDGLVFTDGEADVDLIP